MGEEITNTELDGYDPIAFRSAVETETKILASWFKYQRFADDDAHYGFELEGCLVDEQANPAMKNTELLDSMADPLIVPELGKFNFEINSPTYKRNPHLFRQMQSDLNSFSSKIKSAAQKLNLHPVWIGILPTVRDGMLSLDTMTRRNRYFALAKRITELRNGGKTELNISRYDTISIVHDNIMTEAAATSLQIHTQVRPKFAVRAYNASLLLSGPCTAIMANSPFLYGKKLWDETRIPVFEQSLALPQKPKELLDPVTFGDCYAKNTLLELFHDNLTKYITILPVHFDDNPENLRHLKFLNGQIWRWVRPIVGVDYGKTPHLRLEQRCFPSGPSAVDIVANIAFYIGLLHHFTYSVDLSKTNISFSDCRENFYSCAQLGLKADITWGDKIINVQQLLHDEFIDYAKAGLKDLKIDNNDIHFYLEDIIKNRVRTGWTGAAWQKSFIDIHGFDFNKMTAAYMENQQSNKPVYQWTV